MREQDTRQKILSNSEEIGGVYEDPMMVALRHKYGVYDDPILTSIPKGSDDEAHLIPTQRQRRLSGMLSAAENANVKWQSYVTEPNELSDCSGSNGSSTDKLPERFRKVSFSDDVVVRIIPEVESNEDEQRESHIENRKSNKQYTLKNSLLSFLSTKGK